MRTIDASDRVETPNMERVIKRFYERFREERVAFLENIHGIAVLADRERYASLMLNRLMFCYFIQHKGLLDHDSNYLSRHLHNCAEHPRDTFYRCFLLPLFFAMLGSVTHSDEQKALFGSIPYLGSDIFALHEIERTYPTICIADSSLERLFTFFASYRWSLDERWEDASGNTDVINPGILGYVFEKYINQQQMGAYYTRDDVTQYIAKNTIIPYLFERIASHNAGELQSEAITWSLLREQPDRYIRDAIRQETALPGEDGQEYSKRRTYYTELRCKLAAGEVSTIDDVITYNLDISRFAQDVIQHITEPQLLATWYEEIKQISILDPTCGSGAFLFSALNVLRALYTACLGRMEEIALAISSEPTWQHSTQHQYAILKTILTHNLYGVDIMEEAVEICKLQLFLLLLAQAESWIDIEPLTDITLHIHTGNALVGFIHADDEDSSAATSRQLDARLARTSGIDSAAHEVFEQWRAEQRPLHWMNAFPTIMQQGGFSVILGNPPYVEYNSEKFPYTLRDYNTLPCANLYTCVIERSQQLLGAQGRLGVILPLAAFATRNMIPLMDGLEHWFPASWLSFYHFRPSMLFSGGKVASIPTTIYLAKVDGPQQHYSTHILKWSTQQRGLLFSTLTYSKVSIARDPENRHYYPKFSNTLENILMEKVRQQEHVGYYLAKRPNENRMYYRSAGGLYWKVFINFAWPYATTSNKQCSFHEEYDRDIFVAVFNSSLFWWYYTVTFDTFNLKDYMLFGFRFSYPNDEDALNGLRSCCQQLMDDYRRHAKHLKRGETGSYTIYARKSKAIIDEIDYILAQHYKFTEEELNFIINYDIKYRTGLKDIV